ncbi:MAG: cytochrome c-type biogenesis protein [Tahibacter sp.]
MNAQLSNGIRLLRYAATIALFLVSLSAFAVDTLTFTDAAEEARFQKLTSELRCLVCQNQNLADSDAGLAKDLRQEVYEQLRSGKSNAEIKQYLVSRYSEFVLYDPPVKSATWLLWFGPLLAAAIGGLVIALIVRRRALGTHVAVAGAAVDDKEDW